MMDTGCTFLLTFLYLSAALGALYRFLFSLPGEAGLNQTKLFLSWKFITLGAIVVVLILDFFCTAGIHNKTKQKTMKKMIRSTTEDKKILNKNKGGWVGKGDVETNWGNKNLEWNWDRK